jgi:hypothetical protein
VEADIGLSRLLSTGDCKVVTISRKITDPIQCGRRTVGHDTLLILSLCRGYFGCELEPGRPESEIVSYWGAGYAINAAGDALHARPIGCKAIQGSFRNA